MKKFFLVTLALSSSMAFADVDYSRCNMIGGVQLDNDGRVQPGYMQTIKSQKTEGNKETIVFETSFGNKKFQNEVTIERDNQGRVIKAISGGEKLSNKTLQEYRESMVKGNVMMASFQSGFNEQGQSNFMSQEPTYWIKKKKAEGEEAQKSLPSMGDYEMVQLSKLTKDQAQEVGIDNVEELKRLRQQWKKDKRTSQKLKENYEKVVSRSSLVVPMGMETEFEIVDGVCLPKSMKSRMYNSQTGQVTTFPISSKEKCDKIQAVYKRHERKINECNQAGAQVSQDYFKEMYPEAGGMVGGVAGGYVTGGAGGAGGMYLAGGIAGGGMVGGMGPGLNMGAYPGMGMGMGMYGMGMGGDMNSVQMQNMMCEWTYNRQQPTIGAPRTEGSGVEQQ